jgi:hypothetical protein
VRRSLLGAVLGLVAVPAASAHPVGAAHGGYRATFSSVKPLVLGLQIAVQGGDQRLRIANLTGKTLVILDPDGRPFIRFTDRAVYRYEESSAEWHQVAMGTSYEWIEPRISWNDDSPPPEVAADPTRSHLIRQWAIPGRADGEAFRIKGFLGWGPHAVSGGTPVASSEGDGKAFFLAFGLTAAAVGGGVLLYFAHRRTSSSSRSA